MEDPQCGAAVKSCHVFVPRKPRQHVSDYHQSSSFSSSLDKTFVIQCYSFVSCPVLHLVYLVAFKGLMNRSFQSRKQNASKISVRRQNYQYLSC